MGNIIKTLPLINKINFNIKGSTNPPSNPMENTLWVNTSTPIHYWSINSKEPCKKSNNKNLQIYPFYQTTKTENGITFTDNKDGTIKVNGTATDLARFRPSHNKPEYGLICLPAGTYTVSGCPAGGSMDTYFLECWDSVNQIALGNDVGDSVTFTVTTETYARFNVLIRANTKVSNLVFKPQIEKGSSATSFIKGDATGSVWIETNENSPIVLNGVKNNHIFIKPYKIKQWENGNWVEKTGRFYATPTDYLEITDYLKLDYLTTTGTQYIDTSITVFNQSSFSIDYVAAFTAVNYNYNNLWCSTGNDENFQSWVYSSGKLAYKWGSGTAVQSSTTMNTSKHTYKFDKNGSAVQMLVDGTKVSSSTNANTLNKPIRFFRKGDSYGKAKIYEIKIYVAGVLSYHLVPAKRISDGVIGLRDILNNKFYTNNGSGTFGSGSAIGFC